MYLSYLYPPLLPNDEGQLIFLRDGLFFAKSDHCFHFKPQVAIDPYTLFILSRFFISFLFSAHLFIFGGLSYLTDLYSMVCEKKRWMMYLYIVSRVLCCFFHAMVPWFCQFTGTCIIFALKHFKGNDEYLGLESSTTSCMHGLIQATTVDMPWLTIYDGVKKVSLARCSLPVSSTETSATAYACLFLVSRSSLIPPRCICHKQ